MTAPRDEYGELIRNAEVCSYDELTDADRRSSKARSRELHPVGIFVAALHKATRKREDDQ